MMLRCFNEVRHNNASLRQFVETDKLSTERRMTLLRRFDLSDGEIEAALAEDVATALQFIRDETEASLKAAGLRDADVDAELDGVMK